jgi:hypothetical protein
MSNSFLRGAVEGTIEEAIAESSLLSDTRVVRNCLVRWTWGWSVWGDLRGFVAEQGLSRCCCCNSLLG